MHTRFLLPLFILGLSVIACKDAAYDPSLTANTSLIHRSVEKTTEIIVTDIFSPVVAGRIYAYSNIALYETLRQGSKDYLSLAGQIKDLAQVPEPPADVKVDLNLAGLHAYTSVAKALIFSEQEMEDYRTAMYDDLKAKGLPEEIFTASIAYGQAVADHILAWSKKDNYAQTRSFPKYAVNKELGRWQPTPPAYIEAVEPHWRKIRALTLDSASQFKPLPPTPFSTDTNSLFYKQANDVYKAIETDSAAKMDIANFWDCNPYVMHQQGHLMMATKKITPGGHWMGIVGLATRKAGSDMIGTAEAYVMVSIGLFDGFISCWDEKYRNNLVRPETYINRFIDPDWEPKLQTPPFPEHTSGHSVISSASSVIMTKLFGENFAFADSSEVRYNLPVRQFNSFKDAAAEAAISRFYGGIHYMPAIEYGVVQGTHVGNHVLSKVHTRAK
ncbi:MAG TPA: vanadium-dependent haloperoxidase [Saprospiraceae bacterium]